MLRRTAPPSNNSGSASSTGSDSDLKTDASVGPMRGSPITAAPQHDSHVRAWRTWKTIRWRPHPPVGEATPNTPSAADTMATGQAEPKSAPWLKDLSRFGPAPGDGIAPPNAFDGPEPDTPAWLSKLQNEWVDPKEFLDLWRSDWKTTFGPLYAASRQWQRMWRQGDGSPQQDFFV